MKKFFFSYHIVIVLIALCTLIAFNASQPRAQTAAQLEFEAWISPLSAQSGGIAQAAVPPAVAISLYPPSYSEKNESSKVDVSTKSLSFSKIVRLLELSSESKIVSQVASNNVGVPLQNNGEYLVTIEAPTKTYIGTFESSDLNENAPLRNFLLLIQEYARE